MHIDQLPDDCFLYIFNLFNKFGTLMNCAAVSERWKYLVLERLNNVKYLTNSLQRDCFPVSTLYFNRDDRLEQIEISKWFPRLKILDVGGTLDVDFISKLPIKGLCLLNLFHDSIVQNTFDIPSVEMLAAPNCYDFFTNDVQGPKLKQLFISHCNISKFSSYAKHFPNLKRLHIANFPWCAEGDQFYTGPVLEKLEILEMIFHATAEPDSEPHQYYGFSLADHCPALKSAFHYIQTGKDFYVNSGIKNNFLEDLVIEFEEDHDWSVLRRILSKYPNLKNLAIRGGGAISDENIPELLELLPRIILIEIMVFEKVTKKSNEYIDWYCRRNNRSISFYNYYLLRYQNRAEILAKKWPHLSSKHVRIGRGFDFMKYCFLVQYTELPMLLDPC
ncbi:uncharacterized protein LOC107362063 [Tetranychus urticae]|uniref:uncharacterized protein LOC107362063 n=1 Tax=Tetranychus urticae TaxID=32264 RepID=UPI000D649091|nr:uncharacterized protein LOC107362063 [Tetranychus urticae]